MGGDDSQKLLPWRGIYFPSGAQTSGSNYEINNVTETAVGISWVPPPLASLALASATARLGHFWKAQVGQFCRAPKLNAHLFVLRLPATRHFRSSSEGRAESACPLRVEDCECLPRPRII